MKPFVISKRKLESRLHREVTPDFYLVYDATSVTLDGN